MHRGMLAGASETQSAARRGVDGASGRALEGLGSGDVEPFDTAPLDTAPFDAAPLRTARPGVAPLEAAPLEAASLETAATTDCASTSAAVPASTENAPLTTVSVDELIRRLLDTDREASALHARRTRQLAELNTRATAVGAAHVVIDPRAVRGAPSSEARDAALRDELGARLIVAELAVASRQSESTIRAQLDEATRLARLPAALTALDEGLISPTHARALADGVSDIPAVAIPEFEESMLPSALRGTPAQVRRQARAVRERLHPLSIEIRAARRRAERRVVFEADRDGMAWLHLHLPCADARGAFERIDAGARSLAAEAGESRGIGQIRADIAADLLLHGDVAESDGSEAGTATASAVGTRELRPVVGTPAPGRRGRYAGFRPTVRVTVPVLTLLGRSDGPAVLDGYGPIPTAMAEDLAAEAPSFIRVLTHPETGTVLSVGRTSYAVPADLRRVIQLRDARCRFPGCERGADRCDIDHTRSWEHGGTTSHDNLACLCRAHHRLKHQSTWQVARPPGSSADLVWTSPFGRTVSDSPDPPF